MPELVTAPTFECKKCGKTFKRDDAGAWERLGDIVKFQPVAVGEGFRFDPDQILEAAKGQGFARVAILGELPNGEVWVSGSANAGETVILIELAKHKIIHGA